MNHEHVQERACRDKLAKGAKQEDSKEQKQLDQQQKEARLPEGQLRQDLSSKRGQDPSQPQGELRQLPKKQEDKKQTIGCNNNSLGPACHNNSFGNNSS